MGAYLQGCVLACDLNHKGNSRYESCEISRGVDVRGKYRFVIGADCIYMQKMLLDTFATRDKYSYVNLDCQEGSSSTNEQMLNTPK